MSLDEIAEDLARFAELYVLAQAVSVSWGVRYEEADGSWYFYIRSQAPAENWESPKGRSLKVGLDEVLEYLKSLDTGN